MEKITDVAKKLSIGEESLTLYGNSIAKVDSSSISSNQNGKIILMTAMTPTKAGEGKTTVSIGLGDALAKLGKRVTLCLREPSLGPVFGVKGGGAGGGESTLYPEDDINLHFTGDFHALTSATNLIAACIDNEIFQNSDLHIDPERITFQRAMDMNDRSLRDIDTCLAPKSGPEHHSSFVITAACEMMSCFCLARDEEDFYERVNSMTIGFDTDGKRLFVRDLHIDGAIRKLMDRALIPNLAQTKYGTPAFVHGGPFANISIGTNTIRSTKLGLKVADYVVTEGGFGADLGMEKYLDIVSPNAGYQPSLVVLVCSCRALKMHGGASFDDCSLPDIEKLEIGLANLDHHIRTVKKYGLPVLVAINRFPSDTQEELNFVKAHLSSIGVDSEISSAFIDGPDGALDLARRAVELVEEPNNYSPIVSKADSYFEKIEKVAREVYGAGEVIYENQSDEKIRRFIEEGYDDFDVCISKTPNSLSDSNKLLNDPEGHTLHIRDVLMYTGAKLLVPLTGSVVTMPGLPKVPRAKTMI